MNEDGYLTTADALLYLRTTQRTLYRLLASGKIPAVRIGHQWRFRKTDLDRWIGQQSRSRSADQGAALGTTTPARKRRVLVVDDEPSVRETLTSIFAASEYDVEAVTDGLGAIARLRHGSLRPRHYGPPTAGGRRHSARPRSEASLARNQGRHHHRASLTIQCDRGGQYWRRRLSYKAVSGDRRAIGHGASI